MQIDVDVSGRKIVVFGTLAGTRRVVRRYAGAGARVTLAAPGLLPTTSRTDGVRVVPQPEPDDAAGLLRLMGPAWSAIVVDIDVDLAERVTTLGSQLRLLIQHESPATGGRVALVSGGPGSTRLLTLEAVQALREADAVLFDRLAPTDDLAELAPGAELVDVGKRPYHHPVAQHSIETQLIARARAGQSVVRLKGGDAFVFGRGGEEMLACVAAGVPVRVVPGVSSALAVPAASGIPVTHRGLSHAFSVISGHVPPSAQELEALVQLSGTVVLLMGIANLEQIVAGLCAAGMDPGVPAAVIERGFSPSQRSTFTTVGQLPTEVRRLDLGSPAVVVIGAVVGVAPAAGSTGELLALFDWPAPAEVPRR